MPGIPSPCHEVAAAKVERLTVEEGERFVTQVGILRTPVSEGDTSVVSVGVSGRAVLIGLRPKSEPVVAGQENQRGRTVPVAELIGPPLHEPGDRPDDRTEALAQR